MQQQHVENLSSVIDTMTNIENELYSTCEYVQDEQRAAWACSSIIVQRLRKLHEEIEKLRDQLEALETITYSEVHGGWRGRIASFFRWFRGG